MNHPELGNHSCVLRTAQGEVFTSDAHGILPPLTWLRERPGILKGADIADKLVGKAAAMLFAYGGVRSIWARRMSRAAEEFLDMQGIPHACEELVEMIYNREGSGMCPMERRAIGLGDPAEAFAVFDGLIGGGHA